MKTLEKYLFGTDAINHDGGSISYAISRLPLDNQRVISLHFLQNKSRQQIAIDLNWSLSKVNQKITRGITLLKFELDPGYFEEMDRIPTASSGNGSAPP